MVLLCQAVPRSDLTIVAHELQALKEIHTRQVCVEVVDIAFPAENVAMLHLQLPRDKLDYLAGQHLEILLADGRRRAFSIANAPDPERLLELHVRHVPGGGFTDLVFIDAIGTGYSRLRPEEKADSEKPPEKKDNPYWAVKKDLASIAEFMRKFLTQHNRWQSPLWVGGESFGG